MTVATLQSLLSTGGVQSAIQRASHKTGVDFSYLLGQAQVESSLRVDAKAPTSSASGLYQFVEQSWLGTVKKHGAEHGLGWAADKITQGPSGRYYISDLATRDYVLKLRNNPEVASLMAAEHAADNKAELEATLGREAGGTDLYMAHFLGIGGAKKFLSTLQRNPETAAAQLFPAAAASNRGIFFGEGGRMRSVSEIYDRFATKLQRGVEIAAGGKSLPPVAAPGRPDAAFQLAVIEQQDRPETATLDQLLASADRPNLLRPTPDSAKLAYMLLASMGA
ncbi:lytic transglycosylase domain-containing protein [Sphingomonas sp. ID1715]|uniref:lytic transglycosylase domain-containing protein n=1 Tax=Sphingomonas sp. ID1715 TaxID=1656898 RepID=UPI0014893A15|nr:lytic transglycosylase domain-containing protein [Sphingomonas sp. ID1715]NNM77144.1 lytic transglycosylase domain-containing protein [Sphingomonas sp. ID1715]